MLFLHLDVTSFPRCATSAAIPLLMRVLGEWPVSGGQIAGAVQWLSRLATLHTLHYVTVIGKTAFLKQILEDVSTFRALSSSVGFVTRQFL